MLLTLTRKVDSSQQLDYVSMYIVKFLQAEQNDLRKKKEEENDAHKWDEQRRR